MMETDKLLESVAYILPALVTGMVAYYFFDRFTSLEMRKMAHEVKRENARISLPLRLQAYERMVLFLERISPQLLLPRVKAVTDNPAEYAELLVKHIETEFEHNLTQQIYISDKAWSVIVTAKNATIQLIRNVLDEKGAETTAAYREQIIRRGIQETYPSHSAIVYLKSEVTELF